MPNNGTHSLTTFDDLLDFKIKRRNLNDSARELLEGEVVVSTSQDMPPLMRETRQYSTKECNVPGGSVQLWLPGRLRKIALEWKVWRQGGRRRCLERFHVSNRQRAAFETLKGNSATFPFAEQSGYSGPSPPPTCTTCGIPWNRRMDWPYRLAGAIHPTRCRDKLHRSRILGAVSQRDMIVRNAAQYEQMDHRPAGLSIKHLERVVRKASGWAKLRWKR
jgi:hypothetical protein